MESSDRNSGSSAKLSDENLLFGVLALQTGVITESQLLDAVKQWTFQKNKRLSEILEEASALSSSQINILQPMVAAQAKLHDDDPRIAVKSLQNHHSIELLRRQIDDRDVQASLLPFSEEVAVDPNETYMTLAQTQDLQGKRFQVLRPHARGGLGEVYVAKDTELNREVALKEIQVRYSDQEEARARFLREAEITGNLEHPGIVPVYGVGQYADGRPYYAMRFVEGQSLKQLVDEFFEKFDGRSLSRNIEWRRIVGLLVSVCKAIDFAHSRGVIHRDIKPSNIMAGQFGEALVVDWGLAKDMGSTEPMPSSELESNSMSAKGSGSGSSETREGSALGTPGFMSPEQAHGNIEGTGPPADIYSLGATLYYVLTGKPPFDENDLESTLDKVRRGKFSPPVQQKEGIPESLNQVCLKAMQRVPADRYQSSSKLAEDLELWLADEAVSVTKGSAAERSGRWMRSNRGFVTASFISMVLLTLLSVFAAFEFQRLRGNAESERLNAEQASSKNEKLANENARIASKEKDARIKAQSLANTNKRLAEEAELLAADMQVEADKANRISKFLFDMFQAADPIGQGAAPGFLPKENGGELTARQMLELGAERIANDQSLSQTPLVKAAMLNAIGDAYRQLGIFDQAEPLLIEALEIREKQLDANHPDVAESLHNLGWYYHERGNFPAARPLYDKALEIRRGMKGNEGIRLVANTLHNRAWMLANEDWTDEAVAQFEEALKLRVELLGATHRDAMFSRFALCFTQFENRNFLGAMSHLAFIISNQDSLEGDKNLVAAGIKFAQAVLRRDGNLGLAGMALGDPESNFNLAAKLCQKSLGEGNVYVAVIRAELGLLLQKQKRLEEAEEQYKISMQIARDRVQLEHPRIGNLVRRYADLLKDLGRADEGTELWKEFMVAQRRRFDPRYGKVLEAASMQADFLRDIDRDEEAAQVYLDISQTIRQALGENAGYRYEPGFLGDTLNYLGIVYDSLDERNKAVRAYQDSLAAYDSEQIPASQKAELKVWPTINLAATFLSKAQPEQAAARLLMAQEHIQAIAKADRNEAHNYFLEIMVDLKIAQRAFAEIPGAVDEYRKTIAKNSISSARLTKKLLECLTFSELNSPELRQQLLDLTLSMVRQTLDAGYAIERVQSWKHIDQLKNSSDFNELVSGSATGEPAMP